MLMRAGTLGLCLSPPRKIPRLYGPVDCHPRVATALDGHVVPLPPTGCLYQSSSTLSGASTHMPSRSSQTYVSDSCSPRPDLIACTCSTKLSRISPPGSTTRNDSQQGIPLTEVGTSTAMVHQQPWSSVRPISSTIQDRSSQPGCASGSAVLTN